MAYRNTEVHVIFRENAISIQKRLYSSYANPFRDYVVITHFCYKNAPWNSLLRKRVGVASRKAHK